MVYNKTSDLLTSVNQIVTTDFKLNALGGNGRMVFSTDADGTLDDNANLSFPSVDKRIIIGDGHGLFVDGGENDASNTTGILFDSGSHDGGTNLPAAITFHITSSDPIKKSSKQGDEYLKLVSGSEARVGPDNRALHPSNARVAFNDEFSRHRLRL